MACADTPELMSPLSGPGPHSVAAANRAAALECLVLLFKATPSVFTMLIQMDLRDTSDLSLLLE